MPDEQTLAPEAELGKTAAQIREEMQGGVTHSRNEPPEPPAAPPTPPAEPPTSPPEGGEGNTAPTGDGGAGHSAAPEDAPEGGLPPTEPGAGEGSGEPAPTSTGVEDFFTTTETGGEEQPPPGDQPPATVTQEMRYQSLSERLGYEVHSDDDVVGVVESLRTQDPYEKVSPMLKQAIDFEAKGGDVRQYFNLLGTKADSLTDKEALRKKYFSENSKLAQSDVELANSKFEREYSDRYGVLHTDMEDVDFDTTEEYNRYLDKKKFAESDLKWEGGQAREAIESEQQALVDNAPSQAQMTQEEADQMSQSWRNDSAIYVEDFEHIEVPIDKEGKTMYKIGLNEQTKPLFQEWAQKPESFLEFLGFNADKTVDNERLLDMMSFVAAFSGEGEYSATATMAKHILQRGNKGTLERDLENPGTGKPPVQATGGAVNETQQAINAYRKSVQQGGRR